MTKLPEDSELRKLFQSGATDNQLAAEYGVTSQAVNKRRVALGMPVKPHVARVSAMMPWKVVRSPSWRPHHAVPALQWLRAWLRMRLGDTSLSERQCADAARFERRLRRDGTVLTYNPQSEEGFSYIPRCPEDGRLVIRWPADAPPPPDAERHLWELQ